MDLEIYNYKSSFSNYLKKVSAASDPSNNEKTESCPKRDSVDFSSKAFRSSHEAADAADDKTDNSSKAPIESAQENGSYWKEQTSQVQGAENSDKSKSSKQKTLGEMIQEQMEKIDNMFKDAEYDKSKDTRLSSIKSKIYRGLTLNSSEQQYLAAKDPDTYSTFQQMESARKMFKCSLRACRTRDEVNSMRLSNALTALSEYRKAIKNGGDGSAVVGLNAALENEIKSYASSADYLRLPTAAECNKFDRELAKAKRYECEKRIEDMKARIDKHYKKKRKTIGDGKRTVAQVMASPLARKVLASRRRSGSCSCGSVDFGYSRKYKF